MFNKFLGLISLIRFSLLIIHVSVHPSESTCGSLSAPKSEELTSLSEGEVSGSTQGLQSSFSLRMKSKFLVKRNFLGQGPPSKTAVSHNAEHQSSA